MQRQGATQKLGIAVTVVGSVVMLGWILDIEILKSILPTWVTMKFSTALCFVLSGISLFLIPNVAVGYRDIAKVVLPIAVAGIVLLMASLLSATFLGVRTGIEDLFVQEQAGAVMTTVPGRPSVGTMVNFILMALGGLMALIQPDRDPRVHHVLGWIMGAVGAVALAGYVFSLPVLYYTWEGFSTAMAIHTAILFVLLGVGLILLRAQPAQGA